MHFTWANTALAVLLVIRLGYAVATNGKPIYEMSGKKGALWVFMITFLLWAGGFWR